MDYIQVAICILMLLGTAYHTNSRNAAFRSDIKDFHGKLFAIEEKYKRGMESLMKKSLKKKRDK